MANHQYEIKIMRDRAYELKAILQIPLNYPENPPTFTLTMVRADFLSANTPALPSSILQKLDPSDLQSVNNLKPL